MLAVSKAVLLNRNVHGEAAAKQAGAGMLLSSEAGQVGLRAVYNHPRAWHCLFSGLTGMQ